MLANKLIVFQCDRDVTLKLLEDDGFRVSKGLLDGMTVAISDNTGMFCYSIITCHDISHYLARSTVNQQVI